MDYIFASAIKTTELLLVAISYDIACQWAKNILRRIQDEKFPPDLRDALLKCAVKFAIPKYHFRAHKMEGNTTYSLWLMLGAAISDCEEVERAWWKFEGTQASIREMGPGSRHDTLEDHFGWGNWNKYMTLGAC